MSTRSTPWEPGTPCWVDLSTTDLARTTSFYSRLFGWEIVDTGAEFGHYAMCLKGGLPVAGLGPAQDPNQPSAWTTYLAVEDAEVATKAITDHGGAVAVPPMTVGDQGRMAIAQDPTGAVFGVWQADHHHGARVVAEQGSLTWTDCNSRDPRTAREFYAAVFGYRYTPMPGDFDYATIDGLTPAEPLGGIGEVDPNLPASYPSHWTAYFGVLDAEAACATALAEGGAVPLPAIDTPYGRIATILDPLGAAFKVTEPAGS